MSMLQQILDQMFVDPEILDALDEEQKQILFIKMREEQVKRWQNFEEKCETEGEPKIRNASNSKEVHWLKGSDGEVWVWVMGEHENDLTLEEIIERRTQEEARKLAEKEFMEALPLVETLDFNNVEDESTLKQQLSRMGVRRSGSNGHQIRDSVYEDANYLDDSVGNKLMPWLFSEDQSKQDPLLDSAYFSNNSIDYLTPVSNSSNHSQVERVVTPNSALRSIGDLISNSVVADDNNSEPVPPPRLKVSKRIGILPPKVDEQTDSRILSPQWTHNIVSNANLPAKLRSVNGPDRFETCSRGVMDSEIGSYKPSNIQKNKVKEENGHNSSVIDSKIRQGPEIAFTSLHLPPFPMERNGGVSHGFSTLPSSFGRLSSPHNVKRRSNEGKVVKDDHDVTKRQSEIYEMMKEKQQRIAKEAELEAERVKQTWEEQEKKAREAEAQIRKIAQKAREQHRQQSLRTSTSILPILKESNNVSLRDAVRNLPRPPKPKSRQAIIEWFRTEEFKRGTGLDPKTRRPAPWFHGIISREEVENLLHEKPSGSFLVRVSERIWGYTISYVVGDGKTKHFLVERIPEGYQFLGKNQVVHEHLYDLVTYHETAPITAKGNEILKWAVGQSISPPDYGELLNALPSLKSHSLPSALFQRH